ncbi:uncharacterized protein LOC125869833 [Solanum stenotomum]|uniref:uncharacterized protein LOC125869833 n=1 Tax=Solanum stenotomum TaxID=172797 RepID=UPI0020D06C7A|nr:uncharacterized protein LOC125869833 [Solanum stenotomum]
MVKLRDNIQNFQRVDSEPIHETWLRFRKLLLLCPTHLLPSNVLLQYFYRSLDSVNKSLDGQLARGGITQQMFDITSTLLDEMTKINHAWYTRQDQVSLLNFGMTKEQVEKNQELDENMAKMMSQKELLTQQVMGGIHDNKEAQGGRSRRNAERNEGDFSSLNNKVNSHSNSIKQLEYQMSQLLVKFESKPQEKYAANMMMNSKVNHDKLSVVLTWSGKSLGGNVKVNGEATTSKKRDEAVGLEESNHAPKNDIPKEVEESPKQLTTEDLKTSHVEVASSSKLIKPLPKVSPPFPQRLKMQDENAKFQKFLSVFKTMSINLPLVVALMEMPSYAKFMKELITEKRSMDFEMVELSHSCSPIMTSNVIIKKADLGAFTIPVLLGCFSLPNLCLT